MAAIDAGIKQRNARWILVCGCDDRASRHVAHPLGLFERPKIAKKKLCGKRCSADLCNEIEQIDGLLENGTSSASGNHGSPRKRQVSGFHCDLQPLCRFKERRICLARRCCPKTEPDLEYSRLILIRRRISIRPELCECSASNRRNRVDQPSVPWFRLLTLLPWRVFFCQIFANPALEGTQFSRRHIHTDNLGIGSLYDA